MHIERLNSADEFLSRTQSLRAGDPFRTNILGSVATAVADGSHTYEAYFWWVIINNHGNTVGAAMRTVPYKMVLTPMPQEAASMLARAVSTQDDELPGVSGPTAVVERFIAEYQKTLSPGSARISTMEGRNLIYALAELSTPVARGEKVVATPNDFELVLQWYLEFGVETGMVLPDPEEAIEAGFARNAYRFWVFQGEKVCLAGYAPLVTTPAGMIARIGPVYTPSEHRRQGYAGALTAHLSQELIHLGAKVMLYTDAANPISNSIYQKIGYKLIDETALNKFSAENA